MSEKVNKKILKASGVVALVMLGMVCGCILPLFLFRRQGVGFFQQQQTNGFAVIGETRIILHRL